MDVLAPMNLSHRRSGKVATLRSVRFQRCPARILKPDEHIVVGAGGIVD
jgi:hypothetical protein